jgi:hypothetical protein
MFVPSVAQVLESRHFLSGQTITVACSAETSNMGESQRDAVNQVNAAIALATDQRGSVRGQNDLGADATSPPPLPNGQTLASSVVAPNGFVFDLTTSDTLFVWTGLGTDWVPLAGDTISFQIGSDSTLYALLSWGRFESWTPDGSWSLIAGNVTSYEVGSDGSIFVLQPGGSLSVWQNESLTQLQSNVSSFELSSNGILYVLLPYGALDSWTASAGWSLVAANVNSYEVNSSGRLYVLQPDGNLSLWQNGSLMSVQTNVNSFDLTPNGTVLALLPYGALESWSGSSSDWTLLEGNVSSFQLSPNGTLYVLQPGGDLDIWQNGSGTPVQTGVSSFQVGPDGTVYAMLPNAFLQSWTGTGSSWTQVAGNVTSYQVSANGTLYVLEEGNLNVWEDGSLDLLGADTSSFVVDPNGIVYLLLPANSLYSWSGFGGIWTPLEMTNIASYEMAPNGMLYALQAGVLDVWENDTWARLAANTSSFQLGTDGSVNVVLPDNALYNWSGFGGIWTPLEGEISLFQVASNGMLYALQWNNLAIWENGTWTTLASNAISFQIGSDGTTYALLQGKVLYSWSGFGGTWVSIAGNVNSYQVLPNGEIFVNGSLIN